VYYISTSVSFDPAFLRHGQTVLLLRRRGRRRAGALDAAAAYPSRPNFSGCRKVMIQRRVSIQSHAVSPSSSRIRRATAAVEFAERFSVVGVDTDLDRSAPSSRPFLHPDLRVKI